MVLISGGLMALVARKLRKRSQQQNKEKRRYADREPVAGWGDSLTLSLTGPTPHSNGPTLWLNAFQPKPQVKSV